MAYRRRRSRRFRRSKGTAQRALRLARSVSRKIAGEVKKYDTFALSDSSGFQQYGSRGSVATIDIVDNAVGTANAQFIGNQVRLKYLYLNLRFTLPKDSNIGNGGDRMAMWRILIVQDTSQQSGQQSALGLTSGIFGYTAASNPDLSVLPINPSQPGRYRVLDDSFVRLADGAAQDYIYRRYFYQRRFVNQGRIYYGQNAGTTTAATGRNHIYALIIYCPPYLRVDDTESLEQEFTVSYMSRMAYYDN